MIEDNLRCPPQFKPHQFRFGWLRPEVPVPIPNCIATQTGFLYQDGSDKGDAQYRQYGNYDLEHPGQYWNMRSTHRVPG